MSEIDRALGAPPWKIGAGYLSQNEREATLGHAKKKTESRGRR